MCLAVRKVIRNKKINQGPAEIWTRIARFRVLSANRYTTEPLYLIHMRVAKVENETKAEKNLRGGRRRVLALTVWSLKYEKQRVLWFSLKQRNFFSLQTKLSSSSTIRVTLCLSVNTRGSNIVSYRSGSPSSLIWIFQSMELYKIRVTK